MTWLVPRPMAIGDLTLVTTAGFLDGSITKPCIENISGPAGTTFVTASHPDSRLFPPAPLTGDVGRDRGDAGRALLFLPRGQRQRRASEGRNMPSRGPRSAETAVAQSAMDSPQEK